MKTLLVLFLALAMSKGCDSQQSSWEAATVEYSAMTRGFNERLVLQDGVLKTSRNKAGNQSDSSLELDKEDKKNLFSLAASLDLEALETYKAPSDKRKYDGAAIAKLKIIFEGKTYETQPFDHGNPPAEIAAFVTALTALTPQTDE